jgi:hydrogenase expression/formation protein HypC
MCLGVPGRIVALAHDAHNSNEPRSGIVDFGGVTREVSMVIVDEPVAVGDHVLVHVGFAIRRIPDDEIEATYRFFADLAKTHPEELEGLAPAMATPSESDGTR